MVDSKKRLMKSLGAKARGYLLREKAGMVHDYLLNLAEMLGEIIRDKSICAKDRSWLRDVALSALKVYNHLELIMVMNKVLKDE